MKKTLTPIMLKIGITGGIGSGKTTVCKLFEELGVPVYYADDRAKYLMQHEHFLIDRIKQEFGESIYEDGVLNRKLLAQIVFTDKKKLALLNSLVHPAVYRDTERWMAEQAEKKIPYALEEAALLVETGSYKQLDKLIVVTASLNKRIDRITNRDNVDSTDVKNRVRNQLPVSSKIKLADYIIKNDSGLDTLKKQVIKIHEQIVELGQQKKNE